MTIFKISRLKTFQDISSHSGSLLAQSWYHQQDLVLDLHFGRLVSQCPSLPPLTLIYFDNLIVSLDFVRAKVGRWVIWKMGEVVVNYSQRM